MKTSNGTNASGETNILGETKNLTVIVDALSRQGEGNVALRLVATDEQPLPAFEAGAHVDVHLPGGAVRPYSLAGDPADRSHYLLCVRHDAASRGGSRYVHTALRVGQTLAISPPRNAFTLAPACGYLLLAGGIGITPLLAMAHALDQTGQPFELHYFVRRRRELAFRERLSQGFRHGRCHIWCADEGHSPRRRLPGSLYDGAEGRRLYLCGPAGFMAHVTNEALAHQWPSSAIHCEAFCAPAQAQPDNADEQAFTVELASCGRTFTVPPEKTIAGVLLEHDVAVPLSCEMGICGACLTPVRDGMPDHRDSVQSEAEKSAPQQQIALCCSRSRSAHLVIEL
ncbi:PDR/VanB family oxidoreductase [Dickeya dianthicola]|uniref:PDR/VanB family oxidoreductase n=1 Tax=Dickeya dianthicola TaxID=204039 RepID=UPI0018687341|nr:PDR/VanB family oxidoreductase [Dickeya dianthicola]QOL13192.1 oxidoreductase [Dickeya dianthicola]